MTDLMKVTYETGQPTVSARELHEGLGIETPFKKWIDRMCEQERLLDKNVRKYRWSPSNRL